MDENPTPKPKVPIFNKRDLHKPVSKRLSEAEVAAIAAEKAKAEAEAQAAAEAAQKAAEEALKPKPVPAPEPEPTPVEPIAPEPVKPVAAEPRPTKKTVKQPKLAVTPKKVAATDVATADTTNKSAKSLLLIEHSEATPEIVPDTPVSKPRRPRPTIRFSIPPALRARLTTRPHLRFPARAKVTPPPKLAAALSKVHAPAADTWLVSALLVVVCATQLTLVWYEKTGLIATLLCMLVLIFVAIFRDPLRKLAISLAIIPVATMLGSTIVTHNTFQSTTVLYGTLLALTLVYRYLFTLDEPVERTRLRWMGHIYGLPLMLILGQLLGALDYAVLRHHYQFMHISLGLVFAACFVFAFAEEMLLRGLIQQQASRVSNDIVGIALPSALYAVMSTDRNNLITIFPALVTGVVLALVYRQKRNLVLTTVVNAGSKIAYVGLVATFILR